MQPTIIDDGGTLFSVVPPHTFLSGAPLSELARFQLTRRYAKREFPQIPISITKPYAVAINLVTKKEFAEFVEDTRQEPEHWCEIFRDGEWIFDHSLSWRNPGFEQDDNHPVVAISWYDAQRYIAWKSQKCSRTYRLLTEMEFEAAVRAGTRTAFFWGDEIDLQGAYANGADQASRLASNLFDGSQVYGGGIRLSPSNCGYAYTSPVGMLKPNQLGIHDLTGNVWEWTQDDFSESIRNSAQEAKIIEGSTQKVIRGGSFLMEPSFLRSASRQRDFAWHNDRDIGFRIARDLQPEEESLIEVTAAL